MKGIFPKMGSKKALYPLQYKAFLLARKEGFEPSRRFYPAYSLSRGAPSATWVLPRISFLSLAERVGFEPTGTCAPPVFKTGSFNHSDISPLRRRRLLNTLNIIAYNALLCQQNFAQFPEKQSLGFLPLLRPAPCVSPLPLSAGRSDGSPGLFSPLEPFEIRDPLSTAAPAAWPQNGAGMAAPGPSRRLSGTFSRPPASPR